MTDAPARASDWRQYTHSIFADLPRYHQPPTNPPTPRFPGSLSYSPQEEATENGAVGVAILLVDRLTDYHIVQRSWKKTGFDYWLGFKDAVVFQGCARLEVSGIRQG